MFIEIDGYKIRVKEFGSGDKNLVILQGWGTNADIYDSVANCVSDVCHVYSFDFPGFGESTEPREPWGVDEFADIFEKLMLKLNISEATLLGHSYGGRVIIKLANRRDIPFKIKDIVLVDAAGIQRPKTAKQKRKIRRYKCLKKIFNLKLMHALFPEMIDSWKNKQGSEDYRNASPIMKQCMVKAINEDLTNLLPGIRQETLLIWGDADTATPIRDAEDMDRLIPNSGLAVIKGAGHYCFLEQPVVFRNIMRSYFVGR